MGVCGGVWKVGVGVGCMGVGWVGVAGWGVCRCVLFVSEDCICGVSHVFVDCGRLCAIIE